MSTRSSRAVTIIDDDPIVQALLEEFLLQRGVRSLKKAADGIEAKALYLNAMGKFDLILCDLNMPGFDGIEFLMHLRDENFAGVLLFVTGALTTTVNAADQLAKAYKISYLGYLRKPINFVELDRLLMPLLSTT